MESDVVLDLGWGRLVFGHTFGDLRGVLAALRAEETGRRDICIYPRDPQVLIGLAPDELFLDPSLTLRLDLHRYRPRPDLIRGVFVRTVTSAAEMNRINDIYAQNGMVLADAVTMWANHRTRAFTYLVAEDRHTGRVVGTVTGVDHELAFGDPEGGTSLWCLAVDGQDAPPGTGEALVRVLAERYAARGRAYLDLSVLHDNTAAIALYRKLGFTRTAAVCVKRKNPINTPLFSAPPPGLDDVNPYARIIAEEALRRGIRVEVTDAEWGELRLSMGGPSVLTRAPLRQAAPPTAHGARRCAGAPRRGRRRRRPRRGPAAPDRLRRGRGQTGPRRAGQGHHGGCPRRRGPGAGGHPRGDLLPGGAGRGAGGRGRPAGRRHRPPGGRRRGAPPGRGGRGRPADRRRAHRADHPPAGRRLRVRRTANLHTGGTIDDVTDRLHPAIAEAAVRASRAIGIPVTGLDFLVPDVAGPEHVFIEANERPGLANHEPQPTAA